MLMPGNCRPSMTRTRIWSTNDVSWINVEESLTPRQPSWTHRSGTENPYLYVLWFVRQSFGLTAGSFSPLPQPAMGVVGWWWTFRCLGSRGLVARGPLRANNDHGVSVISTLVFYWLQHNHALRVLFTQSVQRNHCVLKTQQSGEGNAKTDRWTYKPSKICLTGDSVKLHSGVGIRQNLRLVKRLEDGSCTRRRDVGNLQAQSGLVPTKDKLQKTFF